MATALESASLVMVPCGYEDGTLGSLQPTDGSGDFTFTRGSNLSATRVNAAGNIEKGYENLLLQSNSFSNATWAKSSVSVTSGQSGYDGTNDAWLLSKSASNAYINQSNITNGVQAFSIYAKANESNFLYVRIYSDSPRVYFDLINGVATNSGPVISSSMEDVGDGWYRCSFSTNLTAANFLRIYPAEAAFDSSATTGSIYIQDAMLNQGLIAYPYIETTTTSAQGGILEDTPRIDYLSGPNGSLLLEPSRTNLINNSGYFANRVYNSTIITQNYNISPEGVINSALIDKNGVAYGRIDYNFYYPSGTYTYSAFVKGNDIVKLRLDYPGSSKEAYINCSNGQTTNYQSKPMDSISSVNYGNGWYRFICTAEIPSGQTLHVARLYVMDVIGGEGNSNPATAEIYGTQLELASYPTSLIPTYGTSVTRAADVCVGAGNSSTFNSEEGVLYAEVATLADAESSLIIGLSDGTSSNYVQFEYFTNERLYAIINGSSQVVSVQTITQTNYNKIAIKYSSGGSKLYVNGVGYDFGGLNFSANTLNTLNFSAGNGTNSPFYGNVKQVVYFQTALSDAALIELTTL